MTFSYLIIEYSIRGRELICSCGAEPTGDILMQDTKGEGYLNLTFTRRKELCIAAGTSNPALASSIADYLHVKLANVKVSKFSDGETRVNIAESIRGKDVFIVQPTCAPVNDNLIELLIMADALRRASARRVAAVIPYYGYSRQDKKLSSREPITAKLVANLLESTYCKRIIAMDLHADSIQGFFNIPVDHLSSLPIVVNHFRELGIGGEDTCIVSPDVGGVVRARNVAERLNSPLAIISKRRPMPNVAEISEIIGDVVGKKCVMVDDMVDTAGTLCKGAEMLMKRGASEVRAYCTHGVLSGEAIKRISESVLTDITITDTIPLPEEKQIEKIKVVSVARMFGEAIRRAFEESSISELFKS